MFVEEPVQPGDKLAMRLVADQAGVPIATGERLLTLPEFQAIADLRAVNVFQPDLCHCAGFTAAREAIREPDGTVAHWYRTEEQRCEDHQDRAMARARGQHGLGRIFVHRGAHG